MYLQISTCFFFSAVFQSLGTLSPYSQVSTGPSHSTPVNSRALETGWGLLTCVISSCHWSMCLRAHFLSFFSFQDYDSLDIRQRRCSSPGYIDSPTYSRQGMSPIMPRSPQHYGYLGESTGCHLSRHQNFRIDQKKMEVMVWQSFTVHFKVRQQWFTFAAFLGSWLFYCFNSLCSSLDCCSCSSTFRGSTRFVRNILNKIIISAKSFCFFTLCTMYLFVSACAEE